MKIVFKKPERKLDSFLVPIRSDNGSNTGKIRIRMVDDITLEKVLRMRDTDAHVLQCAIKDKEVQERLRSYDEQVLEHVLENCNTWFGTDLSEDKIRDMFLPSLNHRMELIALVSSVIEPDVILNGNILNGFCELRPFLESQSDLTELRILLEIDAQGIYIRSKKFGIRWIVKQLRVIQEHAVHVERPFDLGTRRDVHELLIKDLEEMEKQIQAEIEEMEEKSRSLRDYMKKAKGLLTEAERVAGIDGGEAEKEWATKTESISNMVWNYQRSRS